MANTGSSFGARVALGGMGLALLLGCGGGRPEAPAPEESEVAVGYSRQPAERVTGSVASLSPEEADGRAARVVEMLEGRVAGLTVVRLPNGDVSLRIRGGRSLQGDKEPLLVIDGLPARGAIGAALWGAFRHEKLNQLEHRADAHVFIAFLAYCLQVTLKNRLLIHAPGLTPLSVFEKLSTIQMVEVWIPMLDGRWLVLPRHTQPEPDVQALLEQIRITLPPQPPPRIKSSQLPTVGMNQPAFPQEPLRSIERSAV